MRIPLSLAALSLALAVAAPIAAKEKTKPDEAQDIACSGVFGADSSEVLVKQTFGFEDVVTGIVPGPEGMEMLATTVFPDDPEREIQFIWFDEDTYSYPSSITFGSAYTVPGGVRVGMSVADVEKLNGAPFIVGGFWWDYGGYANITEGALAGERDGACYVSIRFSPQDEYPESLDVTAVSGETQVPSDEPLLKELDARVRVLSIGYAWPEHLPQPEY